MLHVMPCASWRGKNGLVVLARIRTALVGVCSRPAVRASPRFRAASRARRARCDRLIAADRPADDEPPRTDPTPPAKIELAAAADHELRRVPDPRWFGEGAVKLPVQQVVAATGWS